MFWGVSSMPSALAASANAVRTWEELENSLNSQDISTDAEVDASETWDSSSVLIISEQLLTIPSRPVMEIMSKNLHYLEE